MTKNSVIAELETAIRQSSPEKRIETLRRVTNLFLGDADRLNDQQIEVFDDVLVCLIQRIENEALVQLSSNLAPIDKAPSEVVRRLAHHDEISIAGPVLTQSSRLSESDLMEIAKSKSQEHLLAISGRALLPEAVTDILIERGDGQVAHRLVKNYGARFSDAGFVKLMKNAETDESLTEKLGLRLDIPLILLRQLVQKATDAVRARLLALATPENQEQIQHMLASIASKVTLEAGGPRDFVHSEGLVKELNRQGKLNEGVLLSFANGRKYEEMTSTLALFCQAPVGIIEQLMKSVCPDGVIVACKAAKLSWPTVAAILQARFAHHKISEQELVRAKDGFLELTRSSAQRLLRFMTVDDTVKKSA